MKDLGTAAAEAGASYDALPYVSHPFPQMQPARLAGLARLFGLSPRDVSRARVLEIGCASGGHLVPLATRFPSARFLGLDPSARQIADGRSRASALRLGNLELRATGIEGLREDDGSFDYILCHGVWSWVPDAVRAAILAALRDRLAPHGVAYVSYNVLPGWHVLKAIRDSLVAASADLTDPTARIARARELIALMREGTDPDVVWGKLWRQEAARLADSSDDYIGHEFLETDNTPIRFSDFMRDAQRHGLAYLGEAELFTMLPENGDPAIAAKLRDMTGNSLIGVEQMLDVLNGRTFRQTLLIRSSDASAVHRRLEPEALEGLHLVAPLDLEADPAPESGVPTWRDEGGRTIASPEAAAATAIGRVIDALPASTRIDQLAKGFSGEDNEIARDAIFRMVTVGLLDVSDAPVVPVRVPGLKPRVFVVARVDAARGAATTASLRHEIVHLDEAARLVLPLADGTREVAAIVADLERIHAVRGLPRAAEELVAHTLDWAARNGLLTG